MNIVIVGAGDIGVYVATLLSQQKHNVILIDKDRAKLEDMALEIDVAVREGSGTDWQLLDDLLEMKPDLFLALTSQDETNLVSCSLAKQLGYPRTIARVKDNRFLNRMRLDFARLFNVDYFIAPELVVAYEIYKYLVSNNSLTFENFAHGALQMRTLRVPQTWNLSDQSLKSLQIPKGVIVGLICRYQPGEKNPQIIFPHGSDRIFPGDEVTLIGERDYIFDIHRFFGIHYKKLESIVIMGGSLIGINLANILQEKGVHVRLIEKDQQKCLALAKKLPNCTILHHEGLDLDFLLSEKLEKTNYFISCTQTDELNLLGALVAKEARCENVAIVLSNNRFVPLVKRLGIVHVVSPQLEAANRILSIANSQAVTSLVSLYQNQAEIIEITVSLDSKVIGVPLSDLGPSLPKDFLIAMIQSRGRVTIATGESIICPGDTIIVICHPRYLSELKQIF